MEITACPVCGSKNIGIGTLGDGIISGLSSWNEVCRNCGYQGASLVFQSESQYKKFLEALSYQKHQKKIKIENIKEEKLQKTILKKPSLNAEKKNYLFEFFMSVVLTIVFFIILSGGQYFVTFTNDVLYKNNLGTLYLFGGVVGVFLFFFFLIILLEAIYRSINFKKN